MNTEGLFGKDDSTSIAIRVAGIFVPVSIFLYGLLIEFGVYDSPTYIGLLGLTVISALFMIGGIYQLVFPAKTQTDHILFIGGFHFFASVYAIFITGYYNPLSILWIVLIIAAYIRIGTKATIISGLLFTILAISDSFYYEDQLVALGRNLTLLVATLMVSSVAVALIHGKMKDAKVLEDLKDSEELQHNQVQAIINTLTDAIVSIDKAGNVIAYNAAFLDLINTNASVLGDNIDKIVHLRDEEHRHIRIQTILDNIDRTFTRRDLLIADPDNEEDFIKLETIVSPISNTYSASGNASARGFVIMLRDITKAKTLEDERDEFISVVSHELRTPITVAEGTISNTKAMLERDDVPAKLIRPSIDMAYNQVVFLAKMVNDLSTLSRAERGVGDDIEEISIDELMNNFYQEYKSQAEKNNLQLNLDMKTKIGNITTSRLYLTELIQNFITNSIKYTREGSVTLHAKKNTKTKTITVSVSDTGIGISKHDQAKIFEKFYRSEDYRTRETGGTGLGLYVVMKLAKKINAIIDMKSRLNHGSTFSVTVPYDTEKK